MKSYLLLILPFLQLINYVGSDSIKFSLSRRESDYQLEKLSKRAMDKRSLVTQVLQADNDKALYMFTSKLDFGTPKQSLDVLFDTGSFLTWVVSTKCKSSACNGSPKFNGSKSSTYRDTGVKSSALTYADGTSISGSYSNDVVGVGPLSVKDFTFVEATTSTDTTGISGLVGMALPSSDALKKYMLFVQIASKTNIDKKIFTWWIDQTDSAGEISFGSTDPTRYVGTLQWIKVKYPGGKIPYWSSLLNGYKIGSKTYNLPSILGAVFDTGTSITYMRKGYARSLHERLGAHLLDSDGSTDIYGIDCSRVNSLPSISFNFDGTYISFPPSAYMFEYGGSLCLSGIFGQDIDPKISLLVGNILLRNLYSVFDFEKYRMGFAMSNRTPAANRNSSSSNDTSGPGATPSQNVTSAFASSTKYAFNPTNELTGTYKVKKSSLNCTAKDSSLISKCGYACLQKFDVQVSSSKSVSFGNFPNVKGCKCMANRKITQKNGVLEVGRPDDVGVYRKSHIWSGFDASCQRDYVGNVTCDFRTTDGLVCSASIDNIAKKKVKIANSFKAPTLNFTLFSGNYSADTGSGFTCEALTEYSVNCGYSCFSNFTVDASSEGKLEIKNFNNSTGCKCMGSTSLSQDPGFMLANQGSTADPSVMWSTSYQADDKYAFGMYCLTAKSSKIARTTFCAGLTADGAFCHGKVKKIDRSFELIGDKLSKFDLFSDKDNEDDSSLKKMFGEHAEFKALLPSFVVRQG